MQPCAQCRRAKRRCVTVGGHRACLLCVQRRLSCSRLTAPQPSSGAAAAVTVAGGPLLSPASECSPSSLPGDLVSPEIAIALVDLYIRYMHDKPHALFHEPTLRESAVNGSISQVVLLSILGLAARYIHITCFFALPPTISQLSTAVTGYYSDYLTPLS